MPLGKDDILNSALLELYAMGALSEEERRQVETALSEFPELRQELHAIERTLEKYARIHSMPVDSNLKHKIMDQLTDAVTPDPGNNKKSKGNYLNGLLALLAILIVSWTYYYKDHKSWKAEQTALIENCDTLANNLRSQIANLESLLSRDSRIIPVSPTDNYPETELYFHLNDNEQRNFIQIKNLPSLASNESFQLWSLKSDQAPIPLDVFEGEEDIYIPVSYVDATNAYAITIEARGGAESPNLEKLIGVFNI